MNKYPIDKELFAIRMKRFNETPDIMHQIPSIMALECEILLSSYYGGRIWAGLHIIRMEIRHKISSLYWCLVYRLCDKVGWTRLQEHPNAPGYYERHSGKCDKMNCSDINCLDNGIPQWFRKITGMTRYDDP